jgi:NNP family nitrate/nitrite transporter-like MFS transporter
VQGAALGINAGLGNLGVSLMQALAPAAMAVPLFGALGGPPQRDAAGAEVWIQNAALVWVPVLALLAVLAWTGMTNLPMHRTATPVAVGRTLWLLGLGLAAAAAGAWLRVGLGWSVWIALPATIALALALLAWLTPAGTRAGLRRQLGILRHRDSWAMTVLYLMTFGSFIGYAAAFPKLIQDVFGVLPGGAPNPAAPDPLAYAWLGPLVGSLARPAGGWLSDRWGGARVTHWTTIAMTLAASGAALCVAAAGRAAEPERMFPPFLALFLLLFVGAGVGNGSTFRMIPCIFPPEQAGPLLGWASAVAAYGAALVPELFGAQIQARTPERAFYGCAGFYLLCLALNWWRYARRGAALAC